jgi:hypothetical protein
LLLNKGLLGRVPKGVGTGGDGGNGLDAAGAGALGLLFLGGNWGHEVSAVQEYYCEDKAGNSQLPSVLHDKAASLADERRRGRMVATSASVRGSTRVELVFLRGFFEDFLNIFFWARSTIVLLSANPHGLILNGLLGARRLIKNFLDILLRSGRSVLVVSANPHWLILCTFDGINSRCHKLTIEDTFSVAALNEGGAAATVASTVHATQVAGSGAVLSHSVLRAGSADIGSVADHSQSCQGQIC